MDNSKEIIAKISDIAKNVIATICIIGGIGGVVVASFVEGSLFQNIAVISFVLYLNMLLWQWGEEVRMERWKTSSLKLLAVVLLIGAIVLSFLSPDKVVILTVMALALCFLCFFSFDYLIRFLEYLKYKTMPAKLWIISIIVLIAIHALTYTLWIETLYGRSILGAFMVAIVAYLFLSTILFIFFKMIGRDLMNYPLFGINYFNEHGLMIGCWIGLLIVFLFGLERVLFFLPNDWGYYGNEGYQSYRQDLAIWGGMALSTLFIYLLYKGFDKSNFPNAKDK